jgi:histidine triad (HIT) family protein
MSQENCIFCKIVDKIMPAYQIWEDEEHLAFLTPFPNTEGFSVVIPKLHYSSYAFQASNQVLTRLVLAAKEVALKIDRAFEDVGRTGLIFEGFGVDHLHAKLFPMHGTAKAAWQQHSSRVEKYFHNYEGYISSHDGAPADPQVLTAVAARIRNA